MPSFIYIVGLVLVLIISLIFKLFIRCDNKFKELSEKIPSPPALPVFGHTFQLLVSSEKLLPLFDNWIEKFGHRLLYRVGTYYIVSLSNPNDIEKLLGSNLETTKSVDYNQLIPWLGEGLLISNGERWAKRRKLLTPAFHFKILEEFMDVFNQQSFNFVKILKSKFQPGEIFNISPLISKLTLDIICETAMGVKIGAQEEEEDSEYISAIHRMKFLQQYRAFRPWLEPPFIWNMFSYGREEERLIEVLHKFTNGVIKAKKLEYFEANAQKQEGKDTSQPPEDEHDYGKKKRQAFLDLLLEAVRCGHVMSDEDVRAETDTFMFEGHDTVSTGIAFTLFLIGNHPDVQEKVNAELQEVFLGDTTRPVTMHDLGRLKYMECCIKESLRICPSVPMIARSIQRDFELEKGIVLPPDTLVLILPFQLHRNTDIYPDPEYFRPERFLPDEAAGRHPFGYVPFSAGPRNCIGQKFAMMEEKVVIANVLRNLHLASMQKLEELTLMADLILSSKDGIQVKYRNH